jgi:hypothetical protein
MPQDAEGDRRQLPALPRLRRERRVVRARDDRTTSPTGRSCSRSMANTSSASPSGCPTGSCTSPDTSPATPAASPCTSQPTGPGPARSCARSSSCRRSHRPAEQPSGPDDNDRSSCGTGGCAKTATGSRHPAQTKPQPHRFSSQRSAHTDTQRTQHHASVTERIEASATVPRDTHRGCRHLRADDRVRPGEDARRPGESSAVLRRRRRCPPF